MAMKTLMLCIAIVSTYQSVHGQRQRNQRQRQPVNYEYVYYDYYDDYYDYGTPTAARQPPVTRPRARAPETQQQKPLAAAAASGGDEADVGELPEYDLKEIVDAWKEYVKEKENKEKPTEPSFDYDLTAPRRPGQGRFQPATGGRGQGFREPAFRGGVRGGSGPRRQTGVRGSGPRRQTGVRGSGPRRQTGVRGGSGPRRQTGVRGTGVRGPARGTGFRPGTGPRGQTGVRGTRVRGTGTGVRGTGLRGSGVREFLAYEDEYPVEDEIVPVSNGDRFNVEALLTGLRGNGGQHTVASFGSNNNRFPQNQGYQCEPLDSESYSTPDPKQCDKYYECNIKGEEKEKLCPDGLVFDINSQHCDYPAKVNCTGRPDLQEAQKSKHCPRANGFFPFPAEESCQKFYDCRGGKGYLQECPAGVIFDPKIDACVTPDQSARPECTAGKFLGFECPVYEKDEVLRFGNHDRLPSPKSCQEYFSCSRTGQPRLGVCPKKKVFNSESGNCDKPENVKGCETYWKEREKEELEDLYDYDY